LFPALAKAPAVAKRSRVEFVIPPPPKRGEPLAAPQPVADEGNLSSSDSSSSSHDDDEDDDSDLPNVASDGTPGLPELPAP